MHLTYRDEDGYVKLTEEGKKEILYSVAYHNSQNEDKDFSDLVNFILKFYDSSIQEALKNRISENSVRLDLISTTTNNRKKLETWFDANIMQCDKNIAHFDFKEAGLSGEEIVTYFCSEEYQNAIKENGWASTIKGMSDVIRRNSSCGIVEFYEQIKSCSPSVKRR